MSDFSLTDNVGNRVNGVEVKWTSVSSLFKYLKSELLHLMVFPDFLALKNKPISQAAADPIRFHLEVGHKFQLGNTKPEISITPGAQVTLRANAKAGSSLFEDDPFRVTATVPRGTAYAGMSLGGRLDLGASGSSGDLTFGFDRSSEILIEYLKAFPTGVHEPALGEATAKMISSYVIPGDIADLQRMSVHDICAVSGQGALKISGSFKVAVPVNPLASVNLPLGVGALAVKDGVMVGLSGAVTITGSYQIRLRRLDSSIELSFLQGTQDSLKTNLSVSAGISVDLGTTDLLAALLGSISKEKIDPQMLSELSADEIKTFTNAIKGAIDHSVCASLDAALSKAIGDQVVFQYEIHPELLDAKASEAVHRALEGDLSLLTALEREMKPDGTVAPGIRLLNSVMTKTNQAGSSLTLNLLGIINVVSVSQLVRKCEFLTEPASGSLTIKETIEGDRISAIVEPWDRQEALRKAMFDSVLATTAYRASKAVAMPTLQCQNLHFATNSNTSSQTLADYLGWFVALKLITSADKAALLGRFAPSGRSSCLMRTNLDDPACEALFFDVHGGLRPKSDYEEIGRRALQALLEPTVSQINQIRYRFLDDDTTWHNALQTGPNAQLAGLIPLASSDARFPMVLECVIGDLYDIAWWASGMAKAGQQVLNMREFLAGRDPISLIDDHEFTQRRDSLQKSLAGVVQGSKVRFDEPWGMVCLFWASGSSQSSGKLVTRTFTVEKHRP